MAAPIRVGGGYIEIVPQLSTDFKSKINAALNRASTDVGTQAGNTIGIAMATKSTNTFITEMRASSGEFRTLGTLLGTEISKGIASGFRASAKSLTTAMASTAKTASLALSSGLAGANAELLKTEREMQRTVQAQLKLDTASKQAASALTRERTAALQLQSAQQRLNTTLANQVNTTNRLKQSQQQLATSIVKSGTATTYLQRSQVSANGAYAKSLVQLQIEQDKTYRKSLSLSDGFKKATDSAKKFGSSLSSVGDTLSHYVTIPLAAAAAMAVKTGVQFTDLKNRTTAAIAAFQGQAAAQGIVDQITKLSTQMPVAVEDMYQLAQRLAALKTNVAPVTDEVQAFTKAIAAHHLTQTQSNRAMIQFQHIVMGYNINAKELNTLTMDGIPAWDLLSRAVGKSVAELKKMSAAGTLLSSDVTPKLVKFLNTNKEYQNSIKASGESLQGAWIRLKNIFKTGLADDSNSKGVKGLAKAVNDLGTSLHNNMGSIQQFVGSIIGIGTKIVDWVGKIAKGFNSLPAGVKKTIVNMLAIATVIGPVMKVVSVVLKFGSALRGVFVGIMAIADIGAGPVGLIVAAIVAMGLAIYGAWKKSEDFRKSIRNLWSSLTSLGKTIYASIGPVWDQIKNTFTTTGTASDTLGGKLLALGNKMSVWANKLAGAINWVRSNWTSFAAGFVLAFKTWVSLTVNTVVPALQSLWDIIKAVFTSLGQIGNSLGQVFNQWYQFSGGADKAQASLGGVAIAGGTVGKAIVYIVTSIQFMGQAMVAAISIVAILAESFAGLINTLAAVGNVIVSIFTFDPSKIAAALAAVPKAISGSWNQITASINTAGSAVNKLFDVNKMFADNAKMFNDIYAGLNSAKNTSKGNSNSTKGSSNGGGGNAAGSSGSNSSGTTAANAAATAAQKAAQKLADAQNTVKNALSSFLDAMTGSADQINTAIDSLSKTVESAMDSLGRNATGDKLVSYLQGLNNKLQSLANQRDAIIQKIQDAQNYTSTVSGNTLDSAKISNLPYSPTTANGIALGLQQQLVRINQFTAVIKQLAKAGLNKSILQQVIDAGPTDGLALGQALLAADKATWAIINSTQAKIDKSASALGNTASEMIFGSIASLQKKGKSLQDQMNKIATDAINKVAKAFGIGWSDIKQITTSGMNATNSVLTTSLTKTTTSVSSAASANTATWSAMVTSMNKSTGTLVNTTYTKGVQGVVSAMASLAGVKNPLPALKFSEGGVTPGYAPRKDIVPAMLSPGEGIMVPELTRQVGADRLGAWNKMAMLGKNVFSTGGVVDGAAWVGKHKNDPYAGYDAALTDALKAVVDPSLKTVAGMAGVFSGLESKDTAKEYPAIHNWTKDLDKRAGFGGSGSALVQLALNEEKKHPNDSNIYNHQTGQDWCAYFLSYLVQKTGTNKAYWNMNPWFPGWPAVAQWSNAGKSDTVPYNSAQAGDVAVWGGGAHVNLVMKKQNGGLLTIGGNQSNTISHYVRYGPPDRLMRPRWGNVPNKNGTFVNPWPGTIIADTGTGGADGHGGAGGGTPTGNRAIGKTYLNSNNQGQYYPAVDYIFTRESGWNQFAKNPSSGAYGIPQALPGSKMRSAGSDWQTNPLTQIRWGVNYMWDRYGNPNKAQQFWANHHWYDKGAWSIPETQPAVVHKGEMILPTQTAQSFRDALSSKNFKASGDVHNHYSFDIKAAPDIPTEKQIRKQLDYVHTMHGGRN